MTENEIKLHIEKRRRERDELISTWNYILKLNEETKLSLDCYQEIQARISSRMAFIDRSIQDHKRLL